MNASELLTALKALHRVCAGSDLEVEGERPTEDEYQAAMTAAETAIAKATGVPA